MKPQNPNKLYPLFVTTRLADVKRFYTERVGFIASFDSPHYLQVQSGGENGPELCFMTPEAIQGGTPLPEFPGAGVVVSIPTPDADTKYREVVAQGLKPLSEPSNKPWGWRSFPVVDPIGIILDFFHVVDEKSM